MLDAKQVFPLSGLKLNSLAGVLFLLLQISSGLSIIVESAVAESTAVENVTIAVASNFATTLRSLSEEFETDCQCEIKIVVGSTGKLYTQIKQGTGDQDTGYDAFFAADMARPSRLVEQGKGHIDSYMIYATGVLTLTGEIDLNKSKKIAVTDPEHSPYGKAALEYIDSLAYSELIKRKLVYVETIAEAYQLVRTHAVTSAFAPLALSSKRDNKFPVKIIPQETYVPLRQAAVILKENKTTTAFFSYVKSEKAQTLIKTAGYQVDEPGAGE